MQICWRRKLVHFDPPARLINPLLCSTSSIQTSSSNVSVGVAIKWMLQASVSVSSFSIGANFIIIPSDIDECRNPSENDCDVNARCVDRWVFHSDLDTHFLFQDHPRSMGNDISASVPKDSLAMERKERVLVCEPSDYNWNWIRLQIWMSAPIRISPRSPVPASINNALIRSAVMTVFARVDSRTIFAQFVWLYMVSI